MATQLPSLAAAAALPLTLSVHIQDDNKERLQQEKQALQDQHDHAADTLQEHQELLHEARRQSLDLEGRVAAGSSRGAAGTVARLRGHVATGGVEALSGDKENEPDFDAAELRAATAEPRRTSEDAGLWSRLEAGWRDAVTGLRAAAAEDAKRQAAAQALDAQRQHRVRDLK